MQILLLGTDRAFFASPGAPFSDVLPRHAAYAAALRAACGEQSEIRIVTLSGPAHRDAAHPGPGLVLFPSGSRLRLTFFIGLIRGIYAATRDWRPDIVTTQTPWGVGLAGWLIARQTGAAFLPQLHTDIFVPGFKREAWRNRWRRLVARFIMRRADSVRVVSDSLADTLASRFGIARERIHTVPVAVAPPPDDIASTAEAQRAALKLPHSDAPLVVFAGRFYEPKNLPLWIDVAARVAAQHQTVQFVLAGDGPLLDQIRARAAATAHADRFHYTGGLPASDLYRLLAASDVLLLTSDYEGFGRVIVEAALVGTPTLATATSGAASLIADGEDGLLAPSGDVGTLAEKLLTLLGDDRLRAQMGEQARARAERDFAPDRVQARLIDMWRGVAADRV